VTTNVKISHEELERKLKEGTLSMPRGHKKAGESGNIDPRFYETSHLESETYVPSSIAHDESKMMRNT
jgi:hypothetical protein